MKLKLLEQELPREKLLRLGASSLGDSELLAIFLRTGTAGCNVLDLADLLIKKFGGLRNLLTASQDDFCQAKGLGQAKFVQVKAVMEMARRVLAEQLKEPQKIEGSDTAKDFVASYLSQEINEVFAVMFLDSQHRMLAFKTLFYGTINQAKVYPRVVVQEALTQNAAAVILTHNHPSGVAEPSNADVLLTKQIKKALELLDVAVLDHLIVGRGCVVSMAEQGLI